MHQTHHRAPFGFTIIELLISIGIIGVLISLVFPALMNTKARAGEIKSLSNARNVALSMQAYADTFGRWPFAKAGTVPPGYIGEPPPNMMVIPIWPPGSFISASNHWDLSRLWGGLVAQVAPWEENFETWVSPGSERSTLASLTEDGSVAGRLCHG